MKTLTINAADTCGRNPLTVKINNGAELDLFVGQTYNLSDDDYIAVRSVLDAVRAESPNTVLYPERAVLIVQVKDGRCDVYPYEVSNHLRAGGVAFAVVHLGAAEDVDIFDVRVLPVTYAYSAAETTFSDGEYTVKIDNYGTARIETESDTLEIVLTAGTGSSYSSDVSGKVAISAINNNKPIFVRVKDGSTAWVRIPAVVEKADSTHYTVRAETTYFDSDDDELVLVIYTSASFTSSTESVTFAKANYYLTTT